jgi:hypothetical protein
MPASPAVQSAIESAYHSLKPWAIGILLNVLTLALGSGVTDNKGFINAVSQHWVLWSAAAIVGLAGGGVARGVQKYNYVRAVQSGVATSATTQAFVDPSTKVVEGPPPPVKPGGTA